MNKIDFWNDWETSYRLVFRILAVFILLLIAMVLVFQLGELSYFYDWQLTAYLQEVLYPIHSNHSEFLESTINTEISLLLQKVSGGFQLLSPWIVYLFMVVLYVSLMGILTVTTYLSRFWFIVGMGLFIVLMAGAGVGRIGIFGLRDEMAVGLTSMLFIPLAYYFNSVNDGIKTGYRFLSFLGVMVLVGFMIGFTSNLPNPLLYLAYYSYWPALIVSIVFILVIGHEVIYAILALTTQAAGPKASGGNAIHFVVFSVVYLLNLLLVYLKGIGYITWDMYYLNPFLLLSVSAVLGFWGLKGREVLYKGALPFYPFAFLMYSCLAIICFSSILFFAMSGNDSTLEAVEDAVIFGHIAFGGMFFIYIIVNFITLLVKNLPIYKIAFKEDNFPYVTSRLAGMIAVSAFFFASDYAPMSQSVSGYFNGLADLNLLLNKESVAKQYYRNGATYGNVLTQSNGNHKSNYMLGVLENDPEKAIPILSNALKRNPSDFAYASLGSAYEDDNRFFDALFTYQRGLRKFPNSWALRNNLALLYNRTNVTDSVLHYLGDIQGDSWEGTLASANLIAIATMRNLPLSQDEMSTSDRIDFQNNLLGYQITQNTVPEVLDASLLASTGLHLYSNSYLRNIGLASAINGDRTYLQVVDQFISEPRNGDYHEDLKFTKALNFYRQGEVSMAFELMKMLKSEREDDGKTDALLGKWSMELGAPMLASKYFELARESGFAWTTADLAQAYALVGQKSVGQFLLRNEVAKLDSNRTDARKAIVNLDSALSQGKVNWNKLYSFDEIEEDLKNLQNLSSGKNKETLAVDFEMLAMSNPFFEKGVLASVKYFTAVQKDPDTAYSILLNAITFNEYSAPLIKAYIDQCFEMGLLSYAENTILRLYDILTLEEFHAYEIEFEKKKSEAQVQSDNWE